MLLQACFAAVLGLALCQRRHSFLPGLCFRDRQLLLGTCLFRQCQAVPSFRRGPTTQDLNSSALLLSFQSRCRLSECMRCVTALQCNRQDRGECVATRVNSLRLGRIRCASLHADLRRALLGVPLRGFPHGVAVISAAKQAPHRPGTVQLRCAAVLQVTCLDALATRANR